MTRMFGNKGDILDDGVEPFVCVFDARDRDIPNVCDESGQDDASHVALELGLELERVFRVEEEKVTGVLAELLVTLQGDKVRLGYETKE